MTLKNPLLHRGMTALAVIQGESDTEMADTAKFLVEYPAHREMLGRFLFDVENIRMTHVAVVPFRVYLVGKDRGRDAGHFGLQREVLVYDHGLKVLVLQASFWFDQAFLERLGPVNAVAEP